LRKATIRFEVREDDMKIRNLKSLVAISLLFFLCSGQSVAVSASQGEETSTNLRILVLPFTNSTGDEQFDVLSEGFAELLISSLSQYPEIVLVERDHLPQMLKEFELQLQGVLSKNQPINIGKTLGADRFITGGFTLFESKLIVHAHVFDVETTQLIVSNKVEGTIDAMDAVREKLAENIVLEMKEKVKVKKSDSIDHRPEVSLYFIRGLGHYYGNLYDYAIAEFMQVIYMDPKYAEARFWLGRSYYQDKDYDHAQIEFQRFINDFPDHDLMNDVRFFLSEINKH